jgi:hypothetical protein
MFGLCFAHQRTVSVLFSQLALDAKLLMPAA